MVARVKDDSETTTFTLFNKEAEQLIGVPLEKILTELDQVHKLVVEIFNNNNIVSAY